jgi:hypothetical protein
MRNILCHFSMMCSQVGDGGVALQIWREALDLLNKQSQTAGKGCSARLGVGEVLKTPNHRKLACTVAGMGEINP